MTVPEAIQIALQYHQSGRMAEAEQIYRQILAQEPNNPNALHLLGILSHQVGNAPVALDLLNRALAIQPYNADFLSNYGFVLKSLGRIDESIAACRKSLQINPNHPDALVNLGFALTDQEKWDEAGECYLRAIQINPNQSQAYCNYGGILEKKNRRGESIPYYQKAIQLNPNFADAYSNLGVALQSVGRHEEALATARKAIAIRPDMAEAHYNLGYCLLHQRKLRDSIVALHRSIELKPDYAEAYNNLANVYKDLGQMPEAIACFRKAVEMKNGYAIAHSNLVYALHYGDEYTPEQIYAEHLDWARRYAHPLRASIKPHTNDRTNDRKIRVGYVSPNFKEQVINYCFEPALKNHDKSQFQIFCYSDVEVEDPITKRLRDIGHEWREITSLPPEKVAQTILNDQIDILVDLTGHIAYNRMLLFAQKPAPIQVSYLGYQNTTGMDVMDYVITDDHTNPPGMQDHLFTEKLVRIPDCFWAYLPQPTPDVNELPAKQNGYVTFAFLNNFAKLTPRMMKVWCEILRKVPDSRLFVLTRDAQSTADYLIKLFVENQVNPSRLIIEGPRNKPDYMKLFHRFDINLDPFPFNGHTTTHDCLWMGVPVVHMSGNTYHSRYGGSVLKAAGLGDWVTTNLEDYVNLAVKLAGDIENLAQLRRTLRQKILDSVLVDGPGFAKKLESAYRKMWTDWCDFRQNPL